MAEKKTERLLQVLLCLTSTGRPLTRAQLRQAVFAYQDCPTDEAFQRMFERDKVELREMGVPLETVLSDSGLDEDTAYAINTKTWALPELHLTPAEMTAVALAAKVWREEGLADAAARALRKLEAQGVDVDRTVLPAIEPRLAGGEGALTGLQAALDSQRAVRFDYRRSGETSAETRQVEPWALVTSRGRWYVVGHDRGRGDARVFRLSRVIGEVTPIGEPNAYAVPADVDARAMVSRAVGNDEPVRRATLRIKTGAGHGLRRRGRILETADDWDTVEVGFRDGSTLADELTSYGASVVVVEPQELKDAVIGRLRVLVEAV